MIQTQAHIPSLYHHVVQGHQLTPLLAAATSLASLPAQDLSRGRVQLAQETMEALLDAGANPNARCATWPTQCQRCIHQLSQPPHRPVSHTTLSAQVLNQESALCASATTTTKPSCPLLLSIACTLGCRAVKACTQPPSSTMLRTTRLQGLQGAHFAAPGHRRRPLRPHRHPHPRAHQQGSRRAGLRQHARLRKQRAARAGPAGGGQQGGAPEPARAAQRDRHAARQRLCKA
jgi:hypothetical protein